MTSAMSTMWFRRSSAFSPCNSLRPSSIAASDLARWRSKTAQDMVMMPVMNRKVRVMMAGLSCPGKFSLRLRPAKLHRRSLSASITRDTAVGPLSTSTTSRKRWKIWLRQCAMSFEAAMKAFLHEQFCNNSTLLSSL